MSHVDLPRAIVPYRALVVAAWVAVGLLLLPMASWVAERLDASNRIRGSESAVVDDLLRTDFESPFAYHAVLVVSGVPPADSPAGREVLQRIREAVQETPGVAATFSYRNVADSLFLGAGGEGTYLIVGLEPGDGPADALVLRLRSRAAELTRTLRAEHPEATLSWTGAEFLNHDLRRASSEDARRSELRALPLTLALLLLAFGALVAGVLPLVFGVLAIGVALGAAVLLTAFGSLSIMLQSVVSILGLALGIDYALLMVSRFRESLAAGNAVEQAGEDTARHAGHTVLLSGCAVAVGFLALLLVPILELRSVAVGGLLVVGAAVLLATTLLPCLLVWIGPRIDVGRLSGSPLGRAPAEGWRRWGRWVTRHPVLVLVVAGIPTLLLAWPVTRLNTEVPRVDWLPRTQESARAIHELREMERSSVVQGIRLLLELPPGTTALDSAGWSATQRLTRRLAGDERIARVRSLPALTAGLPVPRERLVELLPDSVRDTFVSRDGRVALLEAMPREAVTPKELTQLVRELRGLDTAEATGVTGSRLLVGGLPAYNADYEDIIAGHFPLVVLLVVGGTFLALLIGFRSVLVPLKALALNALSVAAAYGALVLVFQDGWGIRLLGLSEPLDGVFPAVPILVFCTVFGLSMDYEVFLVARVAEARRTGLAEAEAIAEGLARTGRLITSAAAIMIVVFAAFATAEYLPMKLLGFALAVAVLVDATVVRLAIGPALLQLAGRWNWWPGDRRRDRLARSPLAASPAGPVPEPAPAAHLTGSVTEPP